MGDFIVDADVLARARFGTSQLAETLAALVILLEPDPQPWYRHWRATHAAPLAARLAADPVAAAIVRHAFSATWTADFFTVPPPAPDLTLDEELEHLASLDDNQIRNDLATVRGPLPPVLTATGLAHVAGDLLRWVWATTISADWPRRRRLLEADVVSRTSRLSSQGWSGTLQDLRPGVRWLGDGRLQVNEGRHPPRDIRGQDLMFIAAHTQHGWVSWRLPDRYAVVYPVTGIFATTPPPLPDALARLLGPTRARILMHADRPTSTTALTATTGLPLGSVGGHLRVLLDAGLLDRRRSGREVMYWQSAAGQTLVEAVSTARVGGAT